MLMIRKYPENVSWNSEMRIIERKLPDNPRGESYIKEIPGKNYILDVPPARLLSLSWNAGKCPAIRYCKEIQAGFFLGLNGKRPW